MVAVNIGRRTFAGLATPLDYTQMAPVPWLWLEKLFVELGGMHELVLRAPALLAGVLLPWLVWRAGIRLVGEHGALVATALAATSAALLFYSAETKPYGIDAAVTALLLLLAARCLDPSATGRDLHRLGAAGLVASLCSFPAVFLLGGIGIALLSRALRARDRSTSGRLLGWGSAWVTAVAVPQLLLYRRTGQSGEMQAFWEPAMARLGEPGFVGRASEAVNAAFQSVPGLQVWPGTELYLLVLAVGAWSVGRKRGAAAALALVLPLLLVAVAWLLDQFPGHDRLMLFAAPTIALLLGAAVGDVLHLFAVRGRRIATVVVVAVLGWVMLAGARTGLARQKSSGGRELVAQIEAAPPAPVWLSRWGLAIWVYYTTDWHAADTTRLDWYAAQADDGWLKHEAPTFDDGVGRLRDEGIRRVRVSGPSGLTSKVGGLRDAGTTEAWAANEARLIRELAAERPWMLMLHERQPEHDAILRGVRAVGLVVDSIAVERRGSLWRVGLPGDQSPRVDSTSSGVAQR